MANYIAHGMSRKQIRALTKYIREKCGLKDTTYFPVIEFFEITLSFLVEGYNYIIVEYSEMPDKEGETIPSLNTIKIREDVYEKAYMGDGRARFTILHEIGHLFLHDNDRVALCRKSDKTSIKAYEDPEWQADVFAGELIMDEHIIREMSVSEIELRCGVSHAAAECQYKQTRR